METTPTTHTLFGTTQTAYIHDYPDKTCLLERQHTAVGLGNAARYNGLGNLTPAEPGTHYFAPGEFNSLTGHRGKKTSHHPAAYHLHAGKTAARQQDPAEATGLSATDVAIGEAFADPQNTASAGQTAGLRLTEKAAVSEEAFELKLGSQILRNASSQAGLYASGNRRQVRLADMASELRARIEAQGASRELYEDLKK